MPVRCQSSSDAEFDVVVAAALFDGGPSSSHSGSRSDDHVLLAAVFQSRQSRRHDEKDIDEDDNDDDDDISSALCVYRMSRVRQRFSDNIRRCYAGQQKYVGLQFGNRLCVSLVSECCGFFSDRMLFLVVTPAVSAVTCTI